MSGGDAREGILRGRMSRGRLSGKLAGLSLPRQIGMIAFWPFLEQLINFFVTLTALFIATHIGVNGQDTKDLASGMGVISFIMLLGFIMQGAVGMGATAIVSRATGARQYGEANEMANQAGVLGLIAGILSSIVMVISSRILVGDVISMTDMAQQYAVRYMDIAAFTSVFSGVVFALNAALRGSGDTKTPFLVMMCVGSLNLGLSLLFVLGPAPFGWHLPGLAWATVISFAVSCLLLLGILHYRKRKLFGNAPCLNLDQFARQQGENYAPPIFLNLSDARPVWKKQSRILNIGLPQGIEVFGMNMIQLFCLSMISKLPFDGAVGVHTIAVRIESFSFLPGFAIGMAAATLVGQYLGARNALMARITIFKCLKYGVTFMGCAGAMFFLLPGFFMGLFAPNSPEMVQQGIPVLRVMLILEPFFAANIVMKTALRGAGDTRRVMFISYGVMGFFRVGLVALWFFCFPSTMVLWGIWMLFALEGVTQTVIFYKIVKGRSWTRLKV